MIIRQLQQGDENELEIFLRKTPNTSMHIRSNLKREGFARTGRLHQGIYYGALDNAGRICGVIVHYWNGNVIMQPGGHLPALLEALRQGKPEIRGFLGPARSVHLAIKLLDLEAWPMQAHKDDRVYALELSELVVPAPLASGDLTVRAAGEADREQAVRWRLDFNRESLNAIPTPEERRIVEAEIDARIADSGLTFLKKAGAPVSMCGRNAALADSVTVGPVWTPPEHRSKGYARAVVAGSLLQTRENGGIRSILFTDNPAAIKAYEAVGFRPVDRYGLALLAKPFDLGS